MRGGIGMGMQGVQEVVGEDCEYRRAPERCAQGAGVEQEELSAERGYQSVS